MRLLPSSRAWVVLILMALVIASGETVDAQSRCTINGTQGRDALNGTAGPDVICARPGDDYANGFGGNDEVRGGAGNDTVIGGDGRDIIRGRRGNDRLFGVDHHGGDVLIGDGGFDRCFMDQGDRAFGCEVTLVA